jgi:hypothetical protein
LPGAATPSDDLAAEQREFDRCRRELETFLPRARILCLEYGQPDVFPGLLKVALGRYSPQQGMGSAISRGERSAVMECLIELTVACQEANSGVFVPDNVKTSLLARIVRFFR